MGRLKRDPIENDPTLAAAFADADALANASIERKHADRDIVVRGLQYDIDLIKQRILKGKYGIDWRTTAEMNPGLCFD